MKLREGMKIIYHTGVPKGYVGTVIEVLNSLVWVEFRREDGVPRKVTTTMSSINTDHCSLIPEKFLKIEEL